jgi:hypothetical protein
VSEGKYSGCVLYAHMKIEEINLLQIFWESGSREEGE